MAASWEAVNDIVAPPPDPACRDDDGDWSITWESGRRQFSLDLEKRVVGARFVLWNKLDEAAELAKKHAEAAFDKLGIARLTSLVIRYNTVFLLPESASNHEHILPRLVLSNGNGSPLKNFLADCARIGRFGIDFSYRFDTERYAFIKIELPANREKRTAWFDLTVKTPEDKSVPVGSGKASALSDFIDAARRFYEGDYATFVSTALDGLDVDLLDRTGD